MTLHTDIQHLPSFKNAVITIGTFDGVHAGHRRLIEKIIALAKEKKGESVLVTFEPHPRTVLEPDNGQLKLLSTPEEKIKLLSDFNIDHVVIVPFTKEFSLLSARAYISDFIVRHFHPAVIVIGYNHHFGHHRDGNIELLEKLSGDFHYSVYEIPKQLVDEIEVSSTRIRIALQEGRPDQASHLLQRPYSMAGQVIHGNQLGRTIGFPTANIDPVTTLKLIPANGVYAVRVQLKDKLLKGMMNIGTRPTFDGHKLALEVHLFDFHEDIYGETLEIFFIQKMRDEKKFSSVDELTKQLVIDKSEAQQTLKDN